MILFNTLSPRRLSVELDPWSPLWNDANNDIASDNNLHVFHYQNYDYKNVVSYEQTLHYFEIITEHVLNTLKT